VVDKRCTGYEEKCRELRSSGLLSSDCGNSLSNFQENIRPIFTSQEFNKKVGNPNTGFIYGSVWAGKSTVRPESRCALRLRYVDLVQARIDAR
jgi:hypothetical protein